MSENYSVKAVLSAEDGSFRSVFNNAQGILSRFGNSTGGVMGKLGEMRNMVKSGLGFGIWSGIGQRAFDVVGKAVQGVTSNLGSAISRFDTLNTFPKIMEMMDFPGAEKATQRLSDAIDGLPTTLDGITRSTQTLALTMGNIDDATDTAIALNNAFLMSGASAEEAERGTTQFVQMLSVGKVDMASWTSLCQTMGPALTKVAESFGYTGNSAKTDLYQALQDGDITFDQFNKRLSELNGKTEVAGKEFAGFAELAKEGSKGIGTSIENLKVTITKNLANMIKAFDDSGLSIADSLDGVKTKINEGMKAFIGSDTFQTIVDNTIKVKDKMIEAFDGFANSPAMKAVKDSLHTIIKDLGVTIPNVIDALSPILGSIITGIGKVTGAISTMIRQVTENEAFMKFAEAISTAIARINTIIVKVVSHLQPYISAIMDAAADVMNAFGEAADAILDSAGKANTADKAYDNFQKVLGVVKGALMGVADFLKKHHSLILWVIEHLPTIIALIGSVKIALWGMQKIQAFTTLIRQIAGFGKSLGNAAGKAKDFTSSVGGLFSKLSKIGSGAKTAGDDVYSMSKSFSKVPNTAKGACYNISNSLGRVGKAASKAGGEITKGFGTGFTNAMNVVSKQASKSTSGLGGIFGKIGGGISGAFSKVASGIGGAVSKVASGIGGVVSSIANIAGPIAMVAGPAVAAITGIVSAIKAWREAQYKKGQEDAKFTEDQQALINKNKELAESYDQLKESTVHKMQDADAEAEKARALKASYDELLDTNGKVIEGKEKQAESIQGRLYEALGIEKAQVDDLRTEYLGLVDDNGKIKEGYEGRAKAIEAALSEIVGHEISGRDQVLNINNEIMQSIDNLIEKKRLQAQMEVLDDAYVESAKKKKELVNEEKDLIAQLTEEQKKYHDFLHSKGVEREEDLKSLSAADQGYFDEVRGNLETLEKSIQSNRDKQIQCEQDKIVAQEAWEAASEENYAAIETLMARYEGELLSAQEAVRLHGAAAKEVLDKQVSDAQTAYDEIRSAYDNHEKGVSEIQVQSAKQYLEYAEGQRRELLTNQELGLAKELEAEVKNHQAQLAELESHMNDLKKKRDYQYSTEYTSLKRRIEEEKGQLKEAETNYQSHLNGLNTKSQKGYSDLNVLTQTGMNNMVSTIEGAVPSVASSAQSTVEAAVNPFSKLSLIGSMSQSAVNEVKGNIESGKNHTKNGATGMVGGIVGAFAELGSKLNNSATKGIGNVPKAIAFFKPQTDAAAKAVKQGITDNVNPGDLSHIGTHAISGLNQGMWGMLGVVMNTARNIANSVASTIRGALQIHSPSRLTTKFGEYVAKGLVNGMGKGAAAVRVQANKLANAVKESFSSGVKKNVDKETQKTVDNLTAQIKRTSKKNKSKIAELNSKIKQAENQKGDKYVESAKKRVDSLKYYNQINLAQEIQFWTNIRNACKKGTSAYADATRELTEAKRNLKAEAQQATKDYVSNITAKYKELEDTIQSRAESLRGAFKLFDGVSVNNGTSKGQLIKNLNNQITYYKRYDRIMDSLKKKLGANSELYKELEGMDISEIATLQNIDQMSSKELKQYKDLYNQKQNITRKRAEKENATLTKSIKDQISSMTTSYQDALAKMGVGLSSKGNDIGKMINSGITQGLKESKTGLESYLTNLANTMVTAVKKKLKIKSPSRVMVEVGHMSGLGLVNGLKDYGEKVEKQAEDLAKGVATNVNSVNNLVDFPSLDNIQRNMRQMKTMHTMNMEMKSLSLTQQTLQVNTNAVLNVNGRKFAQAIASDMAEVIYDEKKRRRA